MIDNTIHVAYARSAAIINLELVKVCIRLMFSIH
jgi:hypothetical protein